MELLDYEFMRRALLAAVLVGVAAPLVGVFLVQRQLSLMGDGLGHIALAGVAVGLLTSQSPVLTALVAAVVCAVVIELLRIRRAAGADVFVAFMFYGGIAGGVVLLSYVPLDISGGVTSYLFGSILTTTSADVVWFVALSAVIVISISLLGKALYVVGDDAEFAAAMGMPVRLLNVTLAVLTAATVVLSMRIIGLLLISALMVIPVAVARQLCAGFSTTLVCAVLVGTAMSGGGVVVAYHASAPSGGTTVLLGIAVFAVIGASRGVYHAVGLRTRRGGHT